MSKVKHSRKNPEVKKPKEAEKDPLDCEVVGDGKPFIGEIHEAPLYLHENVDIQRGYRINFKSYPLAYKSLFILHNESVNVWSHLCGSIAFVALIFYTVIYLAPPSNLYENNLERWMYSPDTGRLDLHLAMLSDLQCQTLEDRMLGELMEANWLESWKMSTEAEQNPILFHSHYNY